MIKRTLSKHIKRIAQHFPVILLTGPRQVGKTTLLESVAGKKMRCVSLDDLDKRALAQQDPALFLQKFPPPVLIDEVQYAPLLFTYIKIHIDKNRNKNGLFFLTGFQKFHLMQGIQESLAGRVAILDMLGFSAREMEGHAEGIPFLPTPAWIASAEKTTMSYCTCEEIYERIWQGSFPRVFVQQGAERDMFYQSYIQTYLERDVKEGHSMPDTLSFYKFIKASAARTGQLLNYADLARDVEIDQKKTKQWMSILERSGLVTLLPPYSTNITKRIVKTPKLYFLDTGLCAYLTGWDSAKSLEAGAMNGAMLETYVFAEILKSYWHNAKRPSIYFYRDKDMKEIDFLIESNGKLHPIEIKKSIVTGRDSTRNFGVLSLTKKEIGHGVILSLKPEILPLTREITAIPIWKI